MKIKFKRNFRPKGDAADIVTYKAGEVYDLANSYALKYIAREYAEALVEALPEVEFVPAFTKIETHVVEVVEPVKPAPKFGRNKYR